MRRALTVASLLLLAAGAWSYVYGVLDPYWKAQRLGSEPGAYHSDFYGRWLGTRLTFKNGANPYDPSVTREIQKRIYGHVLDGSSTLDPHGFVYPAHVILVLAPFAALPFTVASPIFSAVLLAMALALLPMFMACSRQKWSAEEKFIAVLALCASFPLALALYVQQLTVLVLFMIAAGVVCLRRRYFVFAGILFAFSTIKPQFVLLIIGWLVLWSVTQWRTRYRFLASFVVSVVLLLLLPEVLLSGWVLKWFAATKLFLKYPNLKLPAAWLLPGALAQIVTAAALIPALILLWRVRGAEPDEERFGFAVAVALAATLLLVPIWPALLYNQLLLIPAVLAIAAQWKKGLAGRQRALAVVAVAALASSSAGALFVSTAVLLFRVPVEGLRHWVELPLSNFAVVPLIMPIVLSGLLRNEAPIAEMAQATAPQI